MPKKPKYYQRPDGLYETSRMVNGKRVRFRGRTCAEVDRKILQYDAEKRTGRLMTKIVDEWEREHAQTVREQTMVSYQPAIQRVKAAFPGYASDVRPLDVQRFVRRMESEGFSRSTIGETLSVCKMVFSHAVIAGDIDVSPATEVRMSRGVARGTRSALTEEQEQKVIACRSGDHWLLGYFLMYTGLRRSEIFGLQWQDIDRAAGEIHVRRKVNTTINRIDEFLKNCDKRDIPLLSCLADVLPRNRIGWIFPGANGDFSTKHEQEKIFADYCKAAGITDENGNPAVTMHQFRHSFATLCFESGISSRDAAKLLGDTVEVTEGIYTELRNSKHAESVQTFDAFLQTRARA